MADVAAFHLAGPGSSSSAGALIHETVEQLEKAKLGLLPFEWLATGGTDETPPEFKSTHAIAVDAENKVNGNERNEDYYLEKEGTKTRQEIVPSIKGLDVTKTKV